MDLKGIVNRIKKLEGLKSDIEIAKLLGLSVTAFSERKRTGSIPYKNIVEWAFKKNISIDEVLTGKKPALTPVAQRKYNKTAREYIEKLDSIFSGTDRKGQTFIKTAINMTLTAPVVEKLQIQMVSGSDINHIDSCPECHFTIGQRQYDCKCTTKKK